MESAATAAFVNVPFEHFGEIKRKQQIAMIPAAHNTAQQIRPRERDFDLAILL